MIEEPVFTIQIGQFYLKMPNNLENLRYAEKWIGFFIDYLEKQSKEEKVPSCSDTATEVEK